MHIPLVPFSCRPPPQGSCIPRWIPPQRPQKRSASRGQAWSGKSKASGCNSRKKVCTARALAVGSADALGLPQPGVVPCRSRTPGFRSGNLVASERIPQSSLERFDQILGSESVDLGMSVCGRGDGCALMMAGEVAFWARRMQRGRAVARMGVWVNSRRWVGGRASCQEPSAGAPPT